MIEAVVFAFTLGWFKGYRWKVFNLFSHWSIYPIVMTCLFNIYIIHLMHNGEYWFIEYAKYIKLISLFFYSGLILKYKLYDISIFNKVKLETNPMLTLFTSPVVVGVSSMGIGSVLNTIAVKANDLKMPVFADVSFGTGYSKIDMFDKMLLYGDYHVFGDHTTNLIFLTDWIDLFYSVMSIGDLFIRTFVILIIYYSIKINSKEIIK